MVKYLVVTVLQDNVDIFMGVSLNSFMLHFLIKRFNWYLIGWDDWDAQIENFLKVYVMKKIFQNAKKKKKKRPKIQKADTGDAVSLFVKARYSSVFPQLRNMCTGLI